MTPVEFGWRMATWPEDPARGANLIEDIEAHLRRIDGHFSTVWLSEHLMPDAPWLTPDGDILESWSMLCHFAAAFPSFHYGNMVLANSFRMPSLLAKMAATTQLLTKGRLILGIGAGWHEREYRSYGYDYPAPKVRISQLEEAVQIIRAMWTQSPANFQGKHYQIEDAYCNPQPNPIPPIVIGGAGEKLMLRVVAKHADWWSSPGASPETYAHRLDVLRGHCDAIGRDFDSIVLTAGINCVAVAPTRAEAQRMAESSPHYNPGQPGTSAVGEPEEVAEQLRRFTALGVRHLILRFPDFPRLDSIDRFVNQVNPLLRGT